MSDSEPGDGRPLLGPVHWGVYGGEFLELVMAVFVAQDHPRVIRRAPASGDGGIDLIVPTTSSSVEIQQVKGFTTRLGTSYRRQIKDSFESMMEAPRLDSPISRYSLVVPLDPTPSEQTWFETLTAAATFPCDWLGAVHWHSLATRHPHVVDYFFGAGRDRVAARLRALRGLTALDGEPLSAAEATSRLGLLHTQLNAEDPHYRYDFRTSVSPPQPQEFVGYALAETRREGDTFITVLVSAKHDYAEVDAPIGVRVNFEPTSAEQAEEFDRALRDFELYGRPVELSGGAVSVSVDAPGGLGGTFTGEGFRLGAVPTDPNLAPFRIVAVTPDGHALSEVVVRVGQSTAGPAGGVELHFRDEHELLTGSMLVSPPDAEGNGRLTLNLGADSFPGKPAAAVAPIAELLNDLHPPNRFQLRPRFGDVGILDTAVNESHQLVSNFERAYISDLALLQRFSPSVVLVPQDLDPSFARDLHAYARMLRGETVEGTWTDATIGLQAPRGEVASQEPFGSVLLVEENSVELDDHRIVLGEFTTQLVDAVVAEEQPSDETRLRLVPGANNTVLRRMGGVADSSSAPPS